MPVGALDVLALRSICATFLDKQLFPVLTDLQQMQDRLIERIEKLEYSSIQKTIVEEVQFSNQCNVTSVDELLMGTKGNIHPGEAVVACRIQDLLEKVDGKADARTVPNMVQFEELTSKVEKHTSLLDSQMKLLMQNVEECKTNSINAPTMAHFEQLGADMETKVNTVALKVDRKPDSDDVPSMAQFEELVAAVQQKAHTRELQKLAGTVDRKAFASKVPTLVQLQDLQKEVERKVDACLVPTTAQVDELAAEMKRKANVSNVVSNSQLQKLCEEVKQKANVQDVVTVAQVEDLLQRKVDAVVARKADVGDVPTLAQHLELAVVTERKLSFLANQVRLGNKLTTPVQRGTQGSWDWQPTLWCVPQLVEGTWDEAQQPSNTNGTWNQPTLWCIPQVVEAPREEVAAQAWSGMVPPAAHSESAVLNHLTASGWHSGHRRARSHGSEKQAAMGRVGVSPTESDSTDGCQLQE